MRAEMAAPWAERREAAIARCTQLIDWYETHKGSHRTSSCSLVSTPAPSALPSQHSPNSEGPSGEDVLDTDPPPRARQLAHDLERLGLERDATHLIVLRQAEQDDPTRSPRS